MKSGGQLGNTNATKNKRWREAIDKALKQYNKGDVKQGQALDKIALRLVDNAVVGDSQEFKESMKEIGDRLDGRAAQTLAIDPDANTVVTKAEVTLVRSNNKA